MESQLPGIIRVKVVTKNILLGSLGTQHRAVFTMMSRSEEKDTNFLKETVTFKCFLC